MSISHYTASVIICNEVVCDGGGPDPATGKYTGWITLGLEYRYRPLLNTGPIYDSVASAKEAMKALVAQIKSGTTEEGATE